jgi:23S rRNA-intervening sequence protein
MPDAFAPDPAQPSTAPLFAGAALLDAEKLDCYRIALEFQAIAGQLVPKRGYAELRDQLDRASISIVLNIAEGCGRRSPADKASLLFDGPRQRDRVRGRYRLAWSAQSRRRPAAHARPRSARAHRPDAQSDGSDDHVIFSGAKALDGPSGNGTPAGDSACGVGRNALSSGSAA